jgi:hypothetical protein
MRGEPPAVPENVAPYVDVLGLDRTVKLLLEFGGSPLYLPDTRARQGSAIVKLLGVEAATALGRKLGRGLIRPPLAKPFIASYYWHKDVPVSEIARLLHVDRVTVQRWLPQRPTSQLDLF